MCWGCATYLPLVSCFGGTAPDEKGGGNLLKLLSATLNLKTHSLRLTLVSLGIKMYVCFILRFVVEDASEKYTYHLGICTTAVADPAKNISETGILQLDNKNGNAPHNIGKFVSSEIRIGSMSFFLGSI